MSVSPRYGAEGGRVLSDSSWEDGGSGLLSVSSWQGDGGEPGWLNVSPRHGAERGAGGVST